MSAVERFAALLGQMLDRIGSGAQPESGSSAEGADPDARVAPWELELADRIEGELVDASASYHRSHHQEEDVVEPYVSFVIDTPPHHGLHVELTLGSGQLTIQCNDAEARLHAAAFEQEEGWEVACRRAVAYLFRHDLELRVRAGLSGLTGAIRLGPGRNGWTGELFAVRSGHRRVYADWFETVDGDDSLRTYIDAGDIRGVLERVRELTGIQDVEWLDVVPPVARHDDRELHPQRAIRVASRLFAEMEEYPGDWWMGEFDAGGALHVWGVYGSSLEDAVRSH